MKGGEIIPDAVFLPSRPIDEPFFFCRLQNGQVTDNKWIIHWEKFRIKLRAGKPTALHEASDPCYPSPPPVECLKEFPSQHSLLDYEVFRFIRIGDHIIKLDLGIQDVF